MLSSPFFYALSLKNKKADTNNLVPAFTVIVATLKIKAYTKGQWVHFCSLIGVKKG